LESACKTNGNSYYQLHPTAWYKNFLLALCVLSICKYHGPLLLLTAQKSVATAFSAFEFLIDKHGFPKKAPM